MPRAWLLTIKWYAFPMLLRLTFSASCMDGTSTLEGRGSYGMRYFSYVAFVTTLTSVDRAGFTVTATAFTQRPSCQAHHSLVRLNVHRPTPQSTVTGPYSRQPIFKTSSTVQAIRIQAVYLPFHTEPEPGPIRRRARPTTESDRCTERTRCSCSCPTSCAYDGCRRAASCQCTWTDQIVQCADANSPATGTVSVQL